MAARISPLSLRATDVAPRRAKSRIAAVLSARRLAQALDLGGCEAPHRAGPEVVEAQRAERDTLQRLDRMADRLAHPLDLALAALVDGDLQHAGLDLADTRRRRATVLELTIHEGRKRQVKRMCEAIGHPVEALQRVAFGPLRLGPMRPGAVRRLDPAEVERLRKAPG